MKSLIYIFFFATMQASIYSFEVPGAGGNTINFNDFRNKKILLVNIATGSDRVGQIAELQQLQQQYNDSLVIIGFPSNSFGHESRTSSEVQSFCALQYNANFLLAAKGSVKGEDMQPFYNWLTKEGENGILSSEVKGDFQKYIIDRNGNLLGIFSGSVSPLSPQIIATITEY